MPTSRITARPGLVSVAVLAIVTILCGSSACSDALGLCKPTSRTAGVTILSAWCERYTQCDAKRGTVDACVSERLAIGNVPTDDGCAATCSEDSDCHRSSCNQERIDDCKKKSFAMECAAQVKDSIVRFPDFCDTCFNN